MKYVVNISTIALVTMSLVSLTGIKTEQAIAIGCDTYERVTGDFGNCNGGSTQYARQLWLERYVVCLEQQLTREIAIYNTKVEPYYAEWNPESNEGLEIDQISFQNETVPPLSLSQSQSSAYRRNKDLCNN